MNYPLKNIVVVFGSFLLLVFTHSSAFSQNLVPDSVEFQALKDLWNDTNGRGWTNNTNWPTATTWPTSATAAEMDNWYGIVVTNGDITQISLNLNNLTGTFPKSVTTLTQLTSLDLAHNVMSGIIPDEINNLSKLQTLLVYYNGLTKMPSDLSGLTSIVTITMYNNQIEGDLPVFSNNLTTLQSLDLHANKFSGTIPSSYGSLSNLTALSLYSNNLTGTIPSQLGALSKLVSLFLNSNQLRGPIPSEFGNLTKLEALGLDNNKLSGMVPTTLGGMVKMKNLKMHNNELSGVVPSIFSGMTQLTWLYLYNNRFTGPLPALKGTDINVSNNYLTGTFPTVTAATPITTITASGNEFTGIPSAVSTWTALTKLDFTDNELISLPTSLQTHSNKANLQLLLSNNRLDFSVLESYSSGFKSTSTLLPQKSINDQLTKVITVGTPLVLTARPLGATTAITWQKQNSIGAWTTLANDEDGAANNTYTRNTVVPADAGIYRWVMINSATGLTTSSIQSDPIQVKTLIAFSSDNWGFQYKYDSRRRMTHKKVPGADWVYMVYDDRDRLVFAQDGQQRKTNQWSFTRYDMLNRPIVTGIYTHNTGVDQVGMDTLVSKSNFYETYNAASDFFSYTNTVMPAAKFPGSFEPLTITYYDSYDFLRSDPYFAYKSGQVAGQYVSTSGGAFPSVVGSVTGTWTRVLGKDRQWLRQVNYYDDKGRIVQTIADNHKRGQDITTTGYDFQGKAIATKTSNIAHRLLWSYENPVIWFSEDRARTLSSTQTTVAIYSSQQVSAGADGWIEFTCSIDNGSPTSRWFGFSASSTAFHIDYSVLQEWKGSPAASTVQAVEGGVAKGSPVGAVPGDVIRVERKGTMMYYSKNGLVFYSRSLTSTPALYAHARILGVNAELYNPRISVVGTTRSTERKFEYDHAGRLTKTWHRIDGSPMVLLSQQSYNELGQLVDKKIHSTDSSTFRQSIDYRYNIRGWLTSINGAELSQNSKNTDDATDRKDLFGMDLLYNEVDGGLSNSSSYNGNISAMKWSKNLGLGTTKQLAYKYTYDPMNRLTGATPKTYTSQWNASSAFREDGLTYDLNGNIKTLTRTDANGTTMDQLDYYYGDNESRSNMLRRVSDTGAVTGFMDAAGDQDYSYDSNGNLNVDENKAITSITYNHLNLPDKVTKRTGDYLTYTYDATGRKLYQDVYATDGTLTKRSDYSGEWYYEKDTLKFINHEEGRVVVGTDWSPSPQIYPDPDINSPTLTYLSWGANGTLVSLATVNGQTYVKAVSNQTNGSTGILGGFVVVKPGRKYTVKMKGYNTAATPAKLFVMSSGYAGAGYVLNLDDALPSGSANEGWISATVTVPTTANSLRIGASFQSPVQMGDTFYINAIEVYEYNDLQGNQVATESGHTYEYHLKDHLGNVRMTFTTKDEVDSARATLENNHVGDDRANFLNYDEARMVYSKIFDRTNGELPGYSQRLSGTANEKIGLAKSLSVMPGDIINAEVYTKYFDASNQDVDLQALITALLAPGSSGGVVIDGSGYSTAASLSVPWGGGQGTQTDQNVPKAFLNYIYINRNYDLASMRYKSKPISVAALEDGSNTVEHERLFITDEIGEAGYVYIYLSNEGGVEKEVYFDDFKVEHVKSPVIQSEDFYPFGLRYNNYSRENSLTNRSKLFQGQEHVDDLGLNWDSFHYRNHQPEIGRFFNVDPLSEKYHYNSPYAFSENKVTSFVELEGLEAISIQLGIRVGVSGNVTPGATGSISVGMAFDVKGNVMLYHTESLGICAGAFAGIGVDVNVNPTGTVDDILGWNAGLGFVKSALPWAPGPEGGYQINFSPSGAGGSWSPANFKGGWKNGYGIGVMGYAEGSYTTEIGRGTWKDAGRGVDKWTKTVNDTFGTDISFDVNEFKDYVQSVLKDVNNKNGTEAGQKILKWLQEQKKQPDQNKKVKRHDGGETNGDETTNENGN